MSTYVYIGTVLRQKWDDASRTYTAWDAAGVQTSTRAYTASENAAADAAATQLTLASNQSTIQTNLAQDLVAMQSIIDDTNANINASPAADIKSLARAMRRSIRMTLQQFDGTT
jgi:hypothetical protein